LFYCGGIHFGSVVSTPDWFAYVVLMSESRIEGVDEASQEEIGLMTSKNDYIGLREIQVTGNVKRTLQVLSFYVL